MPMSPRTLRPRVAGAAVHQEAADWKNRVIANGGASPSTATVKAVSDFCKSIDSNGLRSLLWRVNLMVGSDLSSALVPLYRSTSFTGTVQGNTTDTNSNFVSGDYSETSGLVGNGSSKVLNTGLSASFRNGRHMGCVPFALGSTSFRYYMGARNGGTPANGGLWAFYVGSPTTVVGQYSYSDNALVSGDTFGTATVKRLVLGNNVNGTGNAVLYSNGSAIGSATAGADTTLSASIAIFAVGQIAGTFSSYSNARLSGYTIGENMTASQVATYNTIWTTLLTALGRA